MPTYPAHRLDADVNDDLSLFHRPSRHCIPVKLQENAGASVFLKPSDDVIDLTPNPEFKAPPAAKQRVHVKGLLFLISTLLAPSSKVFNTVCNALLFNFF